MIQWLSEWWRFLIMALAVSAINVASVQYLPAAITAGVVTLVNFIAGGNMIFDLINRSSWQRKVQDQAEQISEQKREIRDRDREILNQEREILNRDREILDKDREIAELRRQAAEGRNGQTTD